MAFGNITTLFLNGPTNAVATGWGTNVRKLGLASDAVANITTTTNHGTGAAVSVTASPFAASSTTGAQPNFGWAILPVDMGGATGARRFYRAGAHVLNCAGSASAAVAAADTNLVLNAYRVGVTPSFTRTLLGSSTSAAYNFGALPNTLLALTVSLTLAEIVLEVGETIQYSLDVLSAGTVLTGRIITLRLGTAADSITFPKLSVLADTTGTATGLGSADGVTGKVLGTLGSAAGTSDVQGILGATAGTTGTASGQSDVVGLGSSVASGVGSAAGSAVATGVGGKILGTVGTVEIGGGVVGVPAGSYVIDAVQQSHIHRMALLHGLDSGNPLVVSPTSRAAGALVQSVTGTDTVIVTTTAGPDFSGNVDTWIEGLAAVHGLSAPLVVTAISRTAGAVSQTITTLDGVTTVARQ